MSIDTLAPVYEILAKEVAYVFDKAEFQTLVQAFLAQSGYRIDREFKDAATGFQAVGLLSTTPENPPVLVFRGTDELIDDAANADPQGIGANQFAANQLAIATWIAQATQAQRKPDLVGDSMGGAIAQLAAAALTPQINRVVTFNSPGTSQAAVALFQQNGGQTQNVTHYLIQGDLVSLGGSAFLPGTAILQSLPDPAINPLAILDKHLLRRLLSSPTGLLQTPILVERLNRPEFNFNQDSDYAEFLAAYRAVNPKFAAALTSRNAVENLRTSPGFSFIGLALQIRSALAANQNNLLVGNSQNNSADGAQGDDIILGKGGSDRLKGGTGSDRIEGGDGQDVLAGDQDADLLVGGAGNDSLLGGDNTDRLIGVNLNMTRPGEGEIDRLTGGTGDDRFILGSRSQVFYTDQGTDSVNRDGYALVTDFSDRDTLQLHGEALQYKLKPTSGTLPMGTGIYLNLNGKSELIGIIQGTAELNLQSSFRFV